MKILFIILLFVSSICHGQVDKIINEKIAEGVKTEVAKFIQVVGFDTVKIKSVSGSATLDTLLAQNNSCSIYEISVSGAKVSGTRVVSVTNTAGVMSIRFVDILPWSGTGKLNTLITNNKVIVSVSGTNANYFYQRERKTE